MRTTVILSFLMIFSNTIFATHNRAGEITYRQIDANTIEATVITYTKTSSFPADRDSLEVCWGDGNCEILIRNQEKFMDFDYKMNTYIGQHQYDEMTSFTISVSDPNRNGGILNVNEPHSGQVIFYIESTLFQLSTMTDNTSNQSPIMLEAPIDIGFIRQPFMHTPNAIDLDGDSVAYELITPLMANGQPVPNYMEVDEIGISAENTYSFDEQTGLFIWNSPQIVGEYSIAIKITSYRNGLPKDMVIRDMQILIMPDDNTPPQIQTGIETPDLLKTKTGQTVNLTFSTTDADGSNLSLSASSELLKSENGATFISENNGMAQFTWTIKETQVRSLPYQLVIKAVDDRGAATFKVIRILAQPFSTSVTAIFEEAGYTLFPNPVINYFNIQLPENKINKPTTVSIFDNTGRLVKQTTFQKAEAILNLEINTLTVGNYIVLVQTETEMVGTKLVVGRN